MERALFIVALSLAACGGNHSEKAQVVTSDYDLGLCISGQLSCDESTLLVCSEDQTFYSVVDVFSTPDECSKSLGQ